MTDPEASSPRERIAPVPLVEALSERYLSYALSTITARSLPDVRDGLKPVHRRLLFAMRELRLNPDSAPRKSARVVGDVIGKFHPHGEAAVYDTLVRLAQDFGARYPLIDGQGNFGNIDGDSAAAMRYTEARLTAVAQALLDGIDEDAVDFRPTYDGDGEEPVVLPAGLPHLLANGAQGIAVGMATSIPPHNIGELCEALLRLIDRPETAAADLARLVPGPDFPTGGVLVEPPAAVAEAYQQGRGSFRLRASWQVETLGQGQYQIVVTEIPFQVSKGRLVEKLAELIQQRRLPQLDDVRDESAEDVRLVLVPKSRNVEAAGLMEQLFRLSDLEIRVGLNLNVLDAQGVPRVMSLKEALQAFLAHRHEVLVRRTRHRLDKIDRRLEVLDGHLVAFLNLDEVIRIIREEDEPKPALMERFGISEAQAEAILNMRLRHLRRLEEMEIRRERDALLAERADLATVLDSGAEAWRRVAVEIREIQGRFGADTPLGRRRTRLGEAPTADVVPIAAAAEREPVTVVLSRRGWIRALAGHEVDPAEIRYKEGDDERFVIRADTADKLLLVATDGRVFTLSADKLPRGRTLGEPVRLMVDLRNEADALALVRQEPDGRLLLAAADGRGLIVRHGEAAAQTRAGRQVLNLPAEVPAAVCRPVTGDMVAMIGTNRKLLVLPVDQVPELSRGRGAVLQKYRDARLADLTIFSAAEGLSWRLGDRVRREDNWRLWQGPRGTAGRMPPKGFPKGNRFE